MPESNIYMTSSTKDTSNYNTIHEDSAGAWPEPMGMQIEGAPAFPIDALSICPSFYEQCKAVAHHLQIAVDAPASLGLAIISAAIQRRVKIELRPEQFTESVLWTLCGLRPGERKTPTVERMRRPLVRWEVDTKQATEPALNRKRGERQAARERIKETEKALAVACEGTPEYAKLAEQYGAIARFLELPDPDSPRLLISDATPEALSVFLSRHEYRAACIHDEATLIDVVLGRYSKQPNLGLLLNSYDGNGGAVDRIGRETLILPEAYVSLGLCVQPSVLSKIMGDETAIGRGFAQRFLTCLPESMLGQREVVLSAFPAEVQTAWDELVTMLINDKRERRLTHTLDSWDYVRKVERGLEKSIGPTKYLEPHAEWVSKAAPGQLMRIAAVLHCASGAETDVVALSTLKAAYKLVNYYCEQQQFMAFVNAVSEAVDNDVAAKIVDKLKAKRLSEFKSSYFTTQFNFLRREKNPAEILDSAYTQLRAKGILRPKSYSDDHQKVTAWSVNPKIYEGC